MLLVSRGSLKSLPKKYILVRPGFEPRSHGLVVECYNRATALPLEMYICYNLCNVHFLFVSIGSRVCSVMYINSRIWVQLTLNNNYVDRMKILHLVHIIHIIIPWDPTKLVLTGKNRGIRWRYRSVCDLDKLEN